MIFYDFEVTKHDWLTVLIDPDKEDPMVVINNRERLEQIYQEYKHDIWIGYNNRHYDQYIMKAILCDLSAWEMNKHIIIDGNAGWTFSDLLKNIFMINYDTILLNKSLKQLEGFQGHNIHESSIDFNIDRPLKKSEIDEMVRYCENDVKETMNIFAANIDDFKAVMGLVKEFGFPLSYMSKTKAQISAEILECVPEERTDEFDLYPLDCLRLLKRGQWLTVKEKKNKEQDLNISDKVKGKVYMCPEDWFMDPIYQNYRLYFETYVAKVLHVFAWGGLHGGVKKYHYKCDPDHLLIHVDVASYYPSLMIYHDLLTRNARKPDLFKEIYDKRLKLKREGKKKEQAPLKIVLNGTYGICKDKNNRAYDPRNANLVCVNGQLLLLDLIQKLERVKSFELIQSNTDGLIIKCKRSDFEQVDDICYEWETRTHMNLEFDYIREIWQKDVNNYVFIQYDGKVERKGAYVKELNAMDNDLPIVNKAVIDFMLNEINPEETVMKCDSYVMFQKICKLTNKYDYVTHNGKKYTNKCFRIFASKLDSDGAVQKVKEKENRRDKFSNTSIHSFIENGDITNEYPPDYLDRNYYVEMAKERLKQYGC